MGMFAVFLRFLKKIQKKKFFQKKSKFLDLVNRRKVMLYKINKTNI